MSPILRTALRTTAPRALRTPAASRAPFSARAALRGGSESDIHHPERAEKLERAKQEQLRAQKEGKGEWHPELSSDSESNVKADRDSSPASKENIEQLQKQTAEHVTQKHGQK